MRVGLNAYLLNERGGYRAAGVSVYCDRLLAELPAYAEDHDEIVAFVAQRVRRRDGLHLAKSPLPVDRASVRIAWEQTGLPLQAMRRRIDLLHGLVNVVPELYRGPTVVTVHDLSFLHFPDRLTRKRLLYLKAAVGRSARRATRVIAVSRNTKEDLIELARVPEGRISVVYPGADPSFGPLAEAAEFRPGAFGGRPYILHVGTLEPRKNQDVLVRAFARLRQTRDVPHVLALIGARGWMYESLFRLVGELKLEGHVHFLDYVPPDDLPLWYNGADLFAYPSAYEGFGLPVLEAMACGTPTVTSSSSSLEEISDGACLTVEPGSEEALEAAMAAILEDDSLRRRLRDAGMRRAAEFSWSRCARETMDVYHTVLGHSRNV